jgi:hypothetical protein
MYAQQQGAPWAAPAKETVRRPIGMAVSLIGALMVIVGSTLSWVDIDFSSVGDVSAFAEVASVSGLEGDGVITIVLGFVALLVAGWMLVSRNVAPSIIVIVLSALIGLIALIDIGNVQDKAESPLLAEFARVGIGLWVVAAGACVLVLGGLAGFVKSTKPAPA